MLGIRSVFQVRRRAVPLVALTDSGQGLLSRFARFKLEHFLYGNTAFFQMIKCFNGPLVAEGGPTSVGAERAVLSLQSANASVMLRAAALMKFVS